jgi:hypothetical protein
MKDVTGSRELQIRDCVDTTMHAVVGNAEGDGHQHPEDQPLGMSQM